MPDIGMAVPLSRFHDRALNELATGNLAERMRVDGVARVLVMARRLGLLHSRFGTNGGAAAVIHRVGAGWDPAVMTAFEFADSLPVSDVDAVLAAGPDWAHSVLARNVEASTLVTARAA